MWVDPDRLSGAPCFRGTRIPVQMLIDYVAAGFSLDEFLETVPSLERDQAQRFLELAGEQMKECASFRRSAIPFSRSGSLLLSHLPSRHAHPSPRREIAQRQNEQDHQP